MYCTVKSSLIEWLAEENVILNEKLKNITKTIVNGKEGTNISFKFEAITSQDHLKGTFTLVFKIQGLRSQ